MDRREVIRTVIRAGTLLVVEQIGEPWPGRCRPLNMHPSVQKPGATLRRACGALLLSVAALLPAGCPATAGRPRPNVQIVISKTRRRLDLYSRGRLVRSYPVALGLNPVDDKQREGDRCTPEGSFYITSKNARSRFHQALGLSYPNRDAAERGLRAHRITRAEFGRIIAALRLRRTPPQNTALGGAVMIHGGGVGRDWTWGCVALEDCAIEEVFRAVPIGTPVFVRH